MTPWSTARAPCRTRTRWPRCGSPMTAGVTDEFVEPVVCDAEGTISDNDSVIFFNFRPDRAREITRALVDPEFDGFTRQFFPVTFVCNTEYDASMPNVEVAFPRVTRATTAWASISARWA